SGRRSRRRRIPPPRRIALFPPDPATGVGVARRLDRCAFLCHNTHRSAPWLNRTFIWLSPKLCRQGVRLLEGTARRIQGRREDESSPRVWTYVSPLAGAGAV